MPISQQDALAELKRRGYSNEDIAAKMGMSKHPETGQLVPTAAPTPPPPQPTSFFDKATNIAATGAKTLIKAGASTIMPGSENLIGPAVQHRRDIVSNLPAIGAAAAPMLAGPIGYAAPPARIALGALGGAGGELAKETLGRVPGLTLPNLPKPLTNKSSDAMIEAGKKGAIANTLAEGVGVGLKGIGATFKLAAKTFSPIENQALEEGIKNPELTKPDKFGAKDIEGVAQDIRDKIVDKLKTLRTSYTAALEKSGIKVRGEKLLNFLYKEALPKAGVQVKSDLIEVPSGGLWGNQPAMNLVEKTRLEPTKGIASADDEVINKLSDVTTRLETELKSNPDGLPLSKLHQLRESLDDAIEYGKTMGKQLGSHVLTETRKHINGMIQDAAPGLKELDAKYAQHAQDIRDAKSLLAIHPEEAAGSKVSVQTASKVEKFIGNYFNKGDTEIQRLKDIAGRLDNADKDVQALKDIATNVQFSGRGSNALSTSKGAISRALVGAPKVVGAGIRVGQPLFRGINKASKVAATTALFNNK